MRKVLIVFLILLLPSISWGAMEFTLGGFIKWESMWDSSQMNKNLVSPVFRDNDPSNRHGKFGMSANSSRFNFTVKGPDIFGAKTSGLLEADFDARGSATNATDGFSHTGSFRLRHAMFRLNWPGTELMFGQYWGMFSEFTPETADTGALQYQGAPSQRLAQVRLTQFFWDGFLVGAAICAPADLGDSSSASNPTSGQSSEMPQFQVKLGYEKDLWGKAAFWGKPTGLKIHLAGGYQRARFRAWSGAQAVSMFGEDSYVAALGQQRDQQYLSPWMIQGALFIPLLTTRTPSLAGTASITTQWQIGEGLNAFGESVAADTSLMNISQAGAVLALDRELIKRFSGYIQGQYWFTNQVYANIAWGMSRTYGLDRGRSATPAGATPLALNSNNNDPTQSWQTVSATLWYRPVQALKFGAQYSFMQTKYFKKISSEDKGDHHRIMLAGFFFF